MAGNMIVALEILENEGTFTLSRVCFIVKLIFKMMQILMKYKLNRMKFVSDLFKFPDLNYSIYLGESRRGIKL